MNMVIAKLKVDSKGRLTIPMNFLKANGLYPIPENHTLFAIMKTKYNSDSEIVLEFIGEREEENGI